LGKNRDDCLKRREMNRREGVIGVATGIGIVFVSDEWRLEGLQIDDVKEKNKLLGNCWGIFK
jgi:hypothetical protein